MLRRVATLLLIVAIALGGMVSTACASAHCAQMNRARMRCCPVDGLHAARSCCGGSIAPAAPSGAAMLERAPQTPPLATVIAAVLPPAIRIASHVSAPTPFRGLGPPASLLRQHTSLLI